MCIQWDVSYSGLQIATDLIQVGAILYSPDVETAVNLADNPSTSELIDALWRMPYKAGLTNTAGGLRRIKAMMAESGRPGVMHFGVIITDGFSNMDPDLTVPDATAVKAANTSLYVVGKSVRVW